jgi:hypothetical protein
LKLEQCIKKLNVDVLKAEVVGRKRFNYVQKAGS